MSGLVNTVPRSQISVKGTVRGQLDCVLHVLAWLHLMDIVLDPPDVYKVNSM